MANVDFLDQLALYLSQRGFGETNENNGTVNIFVGKQMPAPDNCITILGDPGIRQPDTSIPDLMYPRFQILIRNNSYLAGSTVLRNVRAALHDKISLSLPNFFVLYIHADQEGFPIGEDSEGRPEFSIHFSSEIRYGDSI